MHSVHSVHSVAHLFSDPPEQVEVLFKEALLLGQVFKHFLHLNLVNLGADFGGCILGVDGHLLSSGTHAATTTSHTHTPPAHLVHILLLMQVAP